MDDVPHITLFTLGVAALGTLLMIPPGITLAWLLARRRWPGKPVVETLVMLPLVLPPVATGLLLLKLLGRHGPLGALYENLLRTPIVFTWKAAVIASAVMAAPLFVRAARVAFEEIPSEIEDSARVCGANSLQLFRSILLPLAARGLVAGAVLAFARALGEFGATMMVAGYIPGETVTLALGIYHHVQLGQDNLALVMAVISAALAFAAVWAGEHLLRRRSHD